MINKLVKILKMIDKKIVKKVNGFEKLTAFESLLMKYKLKSNDINYKKLSELSANELKSLVKDIKKFRERYNI